MKKRKLFPYFFYFHVINFNELCFYTIFFLYVKKFCSIDKIVFYKESMFQKFIVYKKALHDMVVDLNLIKNSTTPDANI